MRGFVAAVAFALIASACGDTSNTSGTAPPELRPSVPIGPGPTSPPTTTTSAPTTTIAATTTITTTSLPPLQGLAAHVVARGLDKPVFVTAPPGDERLFIVEQDGRIRILRRGEVAAEPFLDIDGDVGSGNLEQGLLGLAFHPNFASNGRFFVYYTDNGGDSRVVEYGVGDDPDRADPGSARMVLAQSQPAANHNAGMLAFGPDGYLYIGFGDGGGANDQFGNGQRTDTLLGSIVRLDVDAAEPYAIPPDNPFVGGGGAPEVWAFGLRNPWRFSIDGTDMYIGDVGQNSIEEVDVISVETPGANLGWPILEGTSCLGDCTAGGFTNPIVEYRHTEGCSVIGGYVYRGEVIPELQGEYFFSDWCGGFLRSFRLATADDVTEWDLGVALGNVLSLGVDGAGEIYVTNQEGFLFQLVPVR